MVATKKNFGQNLLAECPRIIALWNEREDWESFTVHSYRRTAATRMAENGATILDIQIAGGWKSEKIARKYVESSNKTKVIINSVSSAFIIINRIYLNKDEDFHQDWAI